MGGGVTGAGIALDAASRGLATALVERRDYGSGTSSRSSKLIHGGLRYLRHLEVGLVRESLHERRVLHRIAPHLVSPMPFVVPHYPHRKALTVWAGLFAYDLLAAGSGYPSHRRLAPELVRYAAPALKPGVRWGLQYWDASTDDARLVWTLVRSAQNWGAVTVNYASVTDLIRTNGRVTGAHVADEIGGGTATVRAKATVNATGVWAGGVEALAGAGATRLRPSKGIHLVVDASRVRIRTALLLPAPDARYVFVIPWQDHRVLIGTTDADYAGPLDDPRALPGEIDYLLGVVNAVLREPLSTADVVATFAGLRPLAAGDAAVGDLSRRHQICEPAPGLVTVTGGKLTAYRPMADEAVRAACESGGLGPAGRCRTARLELDGAALPDGTRLTARYGSRASEVTALDPAARRLHPEAEVLAAEALYAVRSEDAQRPDDVLSRRTRLRITTRDRGLAALDEVCEMLASAHGWDAQRKESEARAYRDSVAADLEAESGART